MTEFIRMICKGFYEGFDVTISMKASTYEQRYMNFTRDGVEHQNQERGPLSTCTRA